VVVWTHSAEDHTYSKTTTCSVRRLIYLLDPRPDQEFLHDTAVPGV